MNFARIWCIPNPTPARRVTPPWNVYMAKFDPVWEGNPVCQTGLPALMGHPTYHGDQIKMRGYMDRWVTPLKRVTSPTWGPPPPCKQALIHYVSNVSNAIYASLFAMKLEKLPVNDNDNENASY